VFKWDILSFLYLMLNPRRTYIKAVLTNVYNLCDYIHDFYDLMFF